MEDINSHKNKKTIAYSWLQMPNPVFNQSIIDSFDDSNDENLLHETYKWLFKHKHDMGGIPKLTEFCERLITPLCSASEKEINSDCFDLLDNLWTENVVLYHLNSKDIRDYLYNYHFDRVADWEKGGSTNDNDL